MMGVSLGLVWGLVAVWIKRSDQGRLVVRVFASSARAEMSFLNPYGSGFKLVWQQQKQQQKQEPKAAGVKSLGESGSAGERARGGTAGDLGRAAALSPASVAPLLFFSPVLSPLYRGFFRTPPPGILM